MLLDQCKWLIERDNNFWEDLSHHSCPNFNGRTYKVPNFGLYTHERETWNSNYIAKYYLTLQQTDYYPSLRHLFFVACSKIICYYDLLFLTILSTDNLWRHNQHTYKIAIFFFPGLSQNFILVRWFFWWMNPTRTKNSKLLNEHLIALRWKIHWYKSFFHSRHYFMNTRILRKIRKTKIVIILPAEFTFYLHVGRTCPILP